MLTTLSPSGLRPLEVDAENSLDPLGDAIWIDLLNPAPAESRAVESALGLQLPTPGEAAEIELSSRLYIEHGAAFMTATVMAGADTQHPETGPITFIFRGRQLVTLRFSDPQPFKTFSRKVCRAPAAYPTAQRVLVGLVDEIVDRLADILESVGANLNAISRVVFSEEASRGRVDYTVMLTRIGHNGELAANARESLVTLARVLSFFSEALPNLARGESVDEHWLTAAKDVAALTDHATFLSSKVNFFLDATLGHINIDQNKIIRIFSVLAVIFLPPTLVASIYGMNFERMPELDWVFGYPFSLALMLLSAILPYTLFKRKGWL